MNTRDIYSRFTCDVVRIVKGIVLSECSLKFPGMRHHVDSFFLKTTEPQISHKLLLLK